MNGTRIRDTDRGCTSGWHLAFGRACMLYPDLNETAQEYRFRRTGFAIVGRSKSGLAIKRGRLSGIRHTKSHDQFAAKPQLIIW